MADNKLPSYEELMAQQSKSDLPSYEELMANPQEIPAEVSKLESASRGAIQGATLGFGEEIGAGIAAPFVAAKRALFSSDEDKVNAELEAQGYKLPESEKTKTGIGDIYRELRDTSRQANKKAEEVNPYTYLAAEIFGGAAPMIGTGGLGAAAKAAGTTAKIAKGALTGAKFGGAQGLGSSEADLTKGEIGEAAKDTLVGTSTGAVVGGVLPAIGGAAKAGYELLPETGKKVIDTGISVAKGLNPFGYLQKKSTDIAESGTKVGKLLQDFDETSNKKITSILSPEEKFNFNNELNQYKKTLVDKLKGGTLEDKASIQNAVENLNQVPGEMNLQQFMDFEKDISSLIPRDKGIARTSLATLRTNIRDDLLNKIKQAYPEQPQVSEQFKDLFAQRAKMHEILDVLPKNIKGATTEDTDVLAKFIKQAKPLSGYGKSPESALPLIGGKSTSGQEFSGAYNKLQELMPESKPLVSKLQEQAKNLEVSKFEPGGGLLMPLATLARYGAGAAGAAVRPAVATVSGVENILDKSAPYIQRWSQREAAKGNQAVAEFLNNFANADVNKKKALTFTASQNPSLRHLVNPSPEQSENKE